MHSTLKSHINPFFFSVVLKQIHSRSLTQKPHHFHTNPKPSKTLITDLHESWSHFNAMLSRNPIPSISSFNRLLTSLSRRRRHSAAISMFSRLFSFRHVDICTFNIAVNSLCRLRLLRPAAAAIAAGITAGISPDAHTISTLLHGLCSAGRSRAAAAVLDRVSAPELGLGFGVNEIAFAAVIAGLCREGNTGEAVRVLNRTPSPSSDCFTPVIDRLWKEGEIDESVRLFREMIGRGIRADVVVYTSMIQGLCGFGRREEAMGVLIDMVRVRVWPNVRTYSVMIDSLCKAGEMKEAVSMFELMIERGLKPDIVVFNSMVFGFCKVGEWVRVEEWLNKMKEFRVCPDIVTTNVLLGARCKEWIGDEVISVLEEMIDEGLVAKKGVVFEELCRFGNGRLLREDGVVSTESLIGKSEEMSNERLSMKDGVVSESSIRELSRLGNEGSLTEDGVVSESLIRKLCRLGRSEELSNEGLMTKDGVNFESLIGKLCRLGRLEDAERLIDEMVDRDIFPNVRTLNIVLNVLANEGKMEKARKMFEEIKERGQGVHRITCNIMIKGYCMLGEMEKAREIFDEMGANGALPSTNTVSYNTLVSGYVRVKRIDIALVLMKEMIRMGLAPDRITRFILKGILADRLESRLKADD